MGCVGSCMDRFCKAWKWKHLKTKIHSIAFRLDWLTVFSSFNSKTSFRRIKIRPNNRQSWVSYSKRGLENTLWERCLYEPRHCVVGSPVIDPKSLEQILRSLCTTNKHLLSPLKTNWCWLIEAKASIPGCWLWIRKLASNHSEFIHRIQNEEISTVLLNLTQILVALTHISAKETRTGQSLNSNKSNQTKEIQNRRKLQFFWSPQTLFVQT